jgi:hypothetical protein
MNQKNRSMKKIEEFYCVQKRNSANGILEKFFP